MKLQELINALQKAQEKVGNVDVMINHSWDDAVVECIDDVILKGSYSLTKDKDDVVKVLILI